ncbi:RidA family protein [Mucilaginibacter ginsenosidivorans]|uniref:RidA family protein n=1 Tax=Mucilaginibacter ginsenosidivorans TaxID=398053 RepID=A0A5B8V1Y8_9SPHI|nr:RidA family protein [Mucilaginibacter ginsenosidivorans]QEC65450.1 RidA family protein [Mucilaginibacter ginsenosidivorans]
MKKLLILPLLLLAKLSFAQADTSLVKFINPASVSTPRGYSHAAIVDLGNCKMLIISGQVALDNKGNLVGKDDFGKQAEQVFQNIKSIVEATGGKMDNVVKLGFFVRDVSQLQALRAVRDKFINVKNPPASTLVQVSKLFRDDILLEVEATAVIPKNR